MNSKGNDYYLNLYTNLRLFFYCISVVDEEKDLLFVKTQIIKTLEDILKDSPALPYFLEFLQSVEAECYAFCWIECEKFRKLAETLFSSRLDSQSRSAKKLPDLVSSIPKNVPVTPLPSPERETNDNFSLCDGNGNERNSCYDEASMNRLNTLVASIKNIYLSSNSTKSIQLNSDFNSQISTDVMQNADILKTIQKEIYEILNSQ